MTKALTQPRDRHIRRLGEDYAIAFMALLPQGQAWPREIDGTLYRTCVGLNNYWGYVDGRAGDLLELESDPRKTVELLPDWERAWGLPDPCFPNATSIEERQKMLVFKMTLLGGQSRAWFEYVSDWSGDEIHITEFAPYMCGISMCGDTSDLDPTGTKMRWELGQPEIRFYWTAHAADPELIWFRCGEGGPQEALQGGWDGGECGVDHHLEINVTPDLDCLLNRWKPAHTELVYDYSLLAEGGPMQGTP